MKKLEKALKRFVLRIVKVIFPARVRQRDISEWRQFSRILVFRLDNRLGNAILILPLIQAIKRSLPDAGVDVLMTSAFCEIYDKHPDIEQVIPYNQKELLKKPWLFLGLIRKLRKNRYDVVLSSSNADTLSVSQAIYSRLLGAAFNIGFQWKNSDQIYSHTVMGVNRKQYADAQIDLWRLFDKEAKYDRPQLYFVDQGQVAVKSQILFWLGATQNKILPKQMVVHLVEFLNRIKTPFTPAAGPADRNLCAIYSGCFESEIVFLQGTLQQTAQFFRQFKLIISPDTGPLHLAVALGIPTVQVFHGSNSTVYAYQDEHTLLIDKVIDETDVKKFIEKYF